MKTSSVSSLALLYCASISSLVSTRIDATTLSAGCSNPSTPPPGFWDADRKYDGVNRSHRYSYPSTGIFASDDIAVPAPLMLYFHGWGGSSQSCGSTCNDANERGYATISLTGFGSEDGWSNSWSGFGSVESGTGSADAPVEALMVGDGYCAGDSGEDDRICNVQNYDVGCSSVRENA